MALCDGNLKGIILGFSKVGHHCCPAAAGGSPSAGTVHGCKCVREALLPFCLFARVRVAGLNNDPVISSLGVSHVQSVRKDFLSDSLG